MIVFNKVTKEYKDGTVALNDISFTINKGEFVFLIGASGSGKTTISRLLIKEILPSKGRIFVDNEEIGKIKKGKISHLRRKVGVAFQDFKLLNDRTVSENISLPLEIIQHQEKEVQKRVKELLTLVGLEEKGGFFPAQLSGGEIQRVVIARALAADPKILFADEPTGNLDTETGLKIINLLRKINESGTTVIVATHNTAVVESLSERVIHLDKGKLQKDAKMEKAKKKTK